MRQAEAQNAPRHPRALEVNVLLVEQRDEHIEIEQRSHGSELVLGKPLDKL